MTGSSRICVAVTGASGAPYTLRLIQVLLAAGEKVDVILSKAALLVMATETDCTLPAKPQGQLKALQQRFGLASDSDQIRVFGRDDWMAPWASGSGQPGPLVICPCSTGTLSAIAVGASDNLIERAADVALKEGRKMILVPRESPYSEIHLNNMLSLKRMGACIIPASPGFYHKPQSVEDLIDFVVARILNQLDIPQHLMPRWGEKGQTDDQKSSFNNGADEPSTGAQKREQ